MRRAAIIVLCSVAALAMSAIATATASADRVFLENLGVLLVCFEKENKVTCYAESATMEGESTSAASFEGRITFTDVELLDTRKTAPGLRLLDRHAVRCGGGSNHRFGLSDAVLIKDNHIAIAGGIEAAVAAVLKNNPSVSIEIEVDTLDQLGGALLTGADVVLLDNMPPATLREAVRETAGRARLEASGGITLDTIAEVAATGVDAISIGALTHSVSALDIALEVHTCQP